jgi:hypothetical protein
MKYISCLILVMMASTAVADSLIEAESILNEGSTEREISAEQNSSSVIPPKQEDMKCYPISTVKRWAKRKKKPAPAPVVVEKVVEKEVPPLKNRIHLAAGVAPTGTELAISSKEAILSQTSGFAVGLGYDRMLDKRWSLGVEALTNGSALINIGLGF